MYTRILTSCAALPKMDRREARKDGERDVDEGDERRRGRRKAATPGTAELPPPVTRTYGTFSA